MNKVNANIKYAAGYIQETAGNVLGNEKMKAEGAAKQAEVENQITHEQKNLRNSGKQLKDSITNASDTVVDNANVKYATGYAQEAAGNTIGNDQIKAEGVANQACANSENDAARVQGESEGTGEKLKAYAKDTIGSVTSNEKLNANVKYVTGYVQETAGNILGNERLQAEGAAKQAQADAEYTAAKMHPHAADEKLNGNAKDNADKDTEQISTKGKTEATKDDTLNVNPKPKLPSKY
ncbi:hypothetical protein K493DRAFT_303731 [Basidiobolus meristosporus CBS 931.73]|uniref:CsbD-like domain-containing protein n=1 Tax=Basidiobolus meristosporus CBS 931.73 TaxID=1314790 RepID=A0A1Y1Y1M0_9FUNG|nr:hypothetical protein K493DRAFT_303731 [Basidiobolus meristosporus CBS 931.73]|eukprot:ORX91912.1 hypothetical protein K493DRAFT_303731 [Basidiobolus meristosporus CBS 931.73]